MKYYLDTEFLEGPQTKRFCGIKTGMTSNTIDLISIGIVSEDGREFYEISKDFNLHEAWNRFQMKQVSGDQRNRYPEGIKEYWIRENVLQPIFEELVNKWVDLEYKAIQIRTTSGYNPKMSFTYKNMKLLINKFGKTNKEISKEIVFFTLLPQGRALTSLEVDQQYLNLISRPRKTMKDVPDFYAYYADYDWVVFCWLFGNMMSLPKGFPKHCIDLKQIMDDYVTGTWEDVESSTWGHEGICLSDLKDHPDYPKNENEHSALDDAKWNKELHEFLNNL